MWRRFRRAFLEQLKTADAGRAKRLQTAVWYLDDVIAEQDRRDEEAAEEERTWPRRYLEYLAAEQPDR